MPNVNIDVNEIMKSLPHRYPFLLVDRIIEISDGKITAIKNVSINEPFFQGHFPGLPVMPGVLIVEALAQVGAYALLSQESNKGKIAYFASIDSVRFRKPVFPGDQLRLEVEVLKNRSSIAKMRGIAKVDGQVVCEGELMCSLGDAALSSNIDKTALIHPSAQIGSGVKIGPYSVIGPEVTIGENSEIGSNVTISRWTKIGNNCKIYPGASIGTPPQDTKYKGDKSQIVIGDRCIIREFVTVHLPTGTGEKTIIGNDCFIMVHAHIPHNAKIGNNVVIGGYVGIGGHAEIEDYATIGGMSAIHQFVRIGSLAMIGGQSKIIQDIPPYMLADGNPAQVRSLNTVGIQRKGISFESQLELKKAFKIIYRSSNNISQAIAEMKKKLIPSHEIQNLISFMEKETDRGILKKTEETIDLLFPEIPELGI